MRSRGLVVAIAIVLAIVAAAAVILYTNQVREDAITDEATQVVIATQDIQAGTQLDPLLTQGVFETINVPNDALVEGAVTSLGQLQGQTTTSPVLAREQIPTSRLATGQSELSQVGVSKDHVGVALSLDGPRGGAGAIRIGDHVAVYVTFNKDTVVLRRELRQILAPAQLKKFFDAAATPDPKSPAIRLGVDFTATIVPSTRVIQAAIPTVTDTNGDTQSVSDGVITLMLDLVPEDAQSIVFANERASVWLGLLPPQNEDGYPVDAVLGPTFDQLLGNAA